LSDCSLLFKYGNLLILKFAKKKGRTLAGKCPWVESICVTKKQTIQEYINKIIEFRQAIYTKGFGTQRDALIEALNVICLTDIISPFALFILSMHFQRQRHGHY